MGLKKVMHFAAASRLDPLQELTLRSIAQYRGMDRKREGREGQGTGRGKGTKGEGMGG